MPPRRAGDKPAAGRVGPGSDRSALAGARISTGSVGCRIRSRSGRPRSSRAARGASRWRRQNRSGGRGGRRARLAGRDDRTARSGPRNRPRSADRRRSPARPRRGAQDAQHPLALGERPGGEGRGRGGHGEGHGGIAARAGVERGWIGDSWRRSYRRSGLRRDCRAPRRPESACRGCTPAVADGGVGADVLTPVHRGRLCAGCAGIADRCSGKHNPPGAAPRCVRWASRPPVDGACCRSAGKCRRSSG